MSVFTILNYFKTTRNILFINVSASRRKPSSGLTSGAGCQYVKACLIRGSVGSSPRLIHVLRLPDQITGVSEENTYRPVFEFYVSPVTTHDI